MKLLNTIRQIAQIGYYTHGIKYRHGAEQRALSNQYRKDYQYSLLQQRDELARTKFAELEAKYCEDANWNKLTLDQKLNKAIKEVDADMFLHPEKYEPVSVIEESDRTAPTFSRIMGVMVLFTIVLMIFSAWHC